MRYLLISDIHSNLYAFEAVLNDAKGLFDKIWCLGDMVGYGPFPNECIELLLTYDHLCIAGNHDWAVLDKLDIEDFNADARFAALWARDQLTPQNRAYLESLPSALTEHDIFTLVHGSPRYPIWEYILHAAIAQPNFDHFSTAYCFVGHTHSAAIFKASDNGSLCQTLTPDPAHEPLQLSTSRLIINPGSVGQPRDGDNRASYGILDMEKMTFEHHRSEYPVHLTQERMKELNFPPRLWHRLAFGW
jgi:predicted phosphodiesterase